MGTKIVKLHEDPAGLVPRRSPYRVPGGPAAHPAVRLCVPMDDIGEALRQAVILRGAADRMLDYATRGAEMGGDAGEACLRKAREELRKCNTALNVHRTK